METLGRCCGGTGEMAQSIKSWLDMPENPSSDSQHPQQGTVMSICNPSTGDLKTGGALAFVDHSV